MQVITRDAGDPFADEVAWWVGQGLRIVESTADRVVLAPGSRPQWRNEGHWWSRARRSARRRWVTINMRPRPSDAPAGPAVTPANYREGYGATWG